jgi:HEAT repeat protein
MSLTGFMCNGMEIGAPGRVNHLVARITADPRERKAIDELIALAGSRNNVMAVNAIAAMGTVGAHHPGLIDEFKPVLLQALRSSTHPRRRAAARSLGAFRQHASFAVDELVERLARDMDTDIAASAARSLGSIGAFPEVVLPALLDAARRIRPNGNLCLETRPAVQAMAAFGAAASPLASELERLVRERDNPELRGEIGNALAKITPGSPVIPPIVEDLFGRPSVIYRFQAITIAESLPAKYRTGLIRTVLVQALSDPIAGIRVAADRLLHEGGRSPESESRDNNAVN